MSSGGAAAPEDLGEIRTHEYAAPAFSPDGRAVAVITSHEGKPRLVLRRAGQPDMPLADLGKRDQSTRVLWIDERAIRVDGGPRVVEVTVR